MECYACAPMRRHSRLWYECASEGGPDSVDPDNGHTGRRAPIVLRPLPHNIANHIPQLLVEQTIECLASDATSLCRCALVCRAWYHPSRILLYSYVDITSRAGYHAIANFAVKSPGTKQYLNHTRILSVTTTREDRSRSPAQWNYFPILPFVLGGVLPNLQCLGFYNSLYPSYHSTFIFLLPGFSEVVHLTLYHLEVCSSMDLRRIVCSFPKLRVLELMNGNLISAQ